MNYKNLSKKITCILLCLCAVMSSFAQKIPTIENFTQEKPVWKCLFIIYPNVQITGTGANDFQNTQNWVISKAHCDSLIKKAEGFKWCVEESTHHRIEIQYDTVISHTPITSLTNTYGAVEIPQEDWDRLDVGSYDVYFVTAQHCCGGWAGLAWGGNPLRITLVNFMSDPYGWNGFVHEWSHSYMQAQSGKAHVSPHYTWADAYTSFGYSASNQAGNPWFAIHPYIAFYHDIMEGTLQSYKDITVEMNGRTVKPHQKYLGTHPSLWRYTRKRTYDQWNLNNDFITAEYENCSGRALLSDQDIPMIEGTDFTSVRDEANGVVVVTGINDYTGTIKVAITSSPVKNAVFFETFGGTVIPKDSVYCHSLITDPGKVFKTGFIFGGWFKEAECRNQWDFGEDLTPDDDITLYVRWVPLSNGNFINLSEENPPSSGTGWTYSNDVFTILDGANVTISGETTSKCIKINTGATATITLDNAKIDATNNTSMAPFTVTSSNTTILLRGKSTVIANKNSSNSNHAGIEQNSEGTLIIDRSEEEVGVLYAMGGRYAAGIGGGLNKGCGTIIINDGIIFSTGDTSRGSGIGGGRYCSGGNITINGGIIAAIGVNPGAAIGRGDEGTINSITINGGTVYAEAWSGAAITTGKSQHTGTSIGPNAVVFMSSATEYYGGQKDPAAVIYEYKGQDASFIDISEYSLSMDLLTDMTIPANHTLGIPTGGTITVADGVRLDNYGAISVYTINGIIKSSGKTFGAIENWMSGNIGTINGIKEVSEKIGLKIYSAEQTLKIEANEPINRIAVTDISGRILLSVSSDETTATISTHKFPKGIYLVTVQTNRGAYTGKVIM